MAPSTPAGGRPSAPPDGVPQHIHDVITEEGFTYHVDYRFPLADIHDDEDTQRIQIRSETAVNRAHARGMSEAVKAGAKIPLIAITSDAYRVFGTHRFEAYKLAKLATIPVIIIEANVLDADDDVLRRLRIIGFRENARHGLPNSKPTKEMAVVELRKDGWENGRIAQELSIASTRVSEIVAVDKGRRALDALGITTPLPKTVVGALGRASDDLNRDPFRELARLAADANLSKTEVNALAKSAKEAGSDTDALTVISNERDEHRTRISGTENPRPSFAAQLRQRLGFIIAKSGNPQVLVEHSTSLRGEHLAMVREAVGVLTAVVELMEAAEDGEEDAA